MDLLDVGAAARPARPGAVRRFITEQLRLVLEQRSLRLAVLGALLAAAFFASLAPSPVGIDPTWMFIVPVAIAAIAGGMAEGLVVALSAAVLCSLSVAILETGADFGLLSGVLAARFALYGITAAFLGAFAEAHHSVQSTLRELASLDPLTKLANVASFYAELGMLERHDESFAVMLVDLDDLKAINDRYGHQTGSAAIQIVASALRRAVRGSDHVARYGGDEFVVILRNADRAGARIVTNRLRAELAAARLPGVADVGVSVSVGVALAGEDGRTSEELLAAADREMYLDKRTKAGRR